MSQQSLCLRNGRAKSSDEPSPARNAMAKGEQRANAIILAGFVGATLFALLALPLWLLPRAPLWGAVLLPVALLTTSLWAVVHEAMHGHLLSNHRANHRAGRLLVILIGSSFRLVRFGHLMHHRFNRYRLDRPDMCGSEKGKKIGETAFYLQQLLFGHYVLEVAVPLLCLLPRPLVLRNLARVYEGSDPVVEAVRQVASQALLSEKNLREIRHDAIASMTLLAASAWCYASHWPLLAAFVVGRGMLLSFFDNVYHFATPADRPSFAWNLRLPALLQRAIFNMNLHQLHHDQPQLPWRRLAARFRDLGRGYDASFAGMALRQLSGPCTPEECNRSVASAVR